MSAATLRRHKRIAFTDHLAAVYKTGPHMLGLRCFPPRCSGAGYGSMDSTSGDWVNVRTCVRCGRNPCLESASAFACPRHSCRREFSASSRFAPGRKRRQRARQICANRKSQITSAGARGRTRGTLAAASWRRRHGRTVGTPSEPAQFRVPRLCAGSARMRSDGDVQLS